MFKHEKQLFHPVGVERPNPQYAVLLQEQLGGGNGEMKAAMQYISQSFRIKDQEIKDLFLDIAAEELGHMEMVAQTINLLNGHDVDANAVSAGEIQTHVLLGLNPGLINSSGYSWTGDYVTVTGDLCADLLSNIASEQRAKVVYEYLYRQIDDRKVKETIDFFLIVKRHIMRCSEKPLTRYRIQALTVISELQRLRKCISACQSLRLQKVRSPVSQGLHRLSTDREKKKPLFPMSVSSAGKQRLYISRFSGCYYSSSDVQLGHLTASLCISVLQKGHSFVAGASSSGFFASDDALLNTFIMLNSTNATMRKLMTAIMNLPYVSVTPQKLADRSLKLTCTSKPITGERISSTREVTIAVKAAPIIIPTARSMTFPRIAKSLNSFKKFFIFTPVTLIEF